MDAHVFDEDYTFINNYSYHEKWQHLQLELARPIETQYDILLKNYNTSSNFQIIKDVRNILSDNTIDDNQAFYNILSLKRMLINTNNLLSILNYHFYPTSIHIYK